MVEQHHLLLKAVIIQVAQYKQTLTQDFQLLQQQERVEQEQYLMD